VNVLYVVAGSGRGETSPENLHGKFEPVSGTVVHQVSAVEIPGLG